VKGLPETTRSAMIVERSNLMVEVVKKRFLLPFGFVDVVILTKQMKELLGETNYERGAWSDRGDLIYHPVSRTGHGRTCQFQVRVSYDVHTDLRNIQYKIFMTVEVEYYAPIILFSKVLKSET